jgi:hypothetical protein
MKLEIGKFELELFDSIDQLPFERFNAFNKYVMLDSELGATVQDFDKITVRVYEFLNKEMYDDAKNELLNLRIVVNNILTGNSSKGLAFASLISKVNGKAMQDYSEDKLKALLLDLSKEGLDVKTVAETASDVKKK